MRRNAIADAVNGLRDILLKLLSILGVTFGCGIVGFVVPLLFDRDVGGALASMIFGSVGVIIGIFLGLWVTKRVFD